jgi:hypothetical protein
MTGLAFGAALLALLAWGLERNHRRQPPAPRPRLNGTTDVADRDAERVEAELLRGEATDADTVKGCPSSSN